MKNDLTIYTGSYNQPIGTGDGTVYRGRGDGVQMFSMDRVTGSVGPDSETFDIPNASWIDISENGKYLYTVNELDSYNGQAGGAVSAYEIGADGRLKYLNTTATEGKAPCYLCLNHDGTFLAAANYSSGTAVFFEATDGRLGKMTQKLTFQGTGPDPVRQEASHIHCVKFDQDESHLLIVNLGDDTIRAYKYSKNEHRLSEGEEADCVFHDVPGSGPRNLVFSKDGKYLYVTEEMSATVSVLRYNGQTGAMKCIQRTAVTSQPPREYCDASGIVITPDDHHLYVTSRGPDMIAGYAIDQSNGMLTLIQELKTEGKNPRAIAISPDGHWVLVCNKDTDNVTVFERDSESGQLKVNGQIEVKTPVFARII